LTRKALFAGLVVDEFENPVETGYVGEDPCYIVNDAGFMRHIPSDQVDRQVLASMQEMIEGHEDLISEQAAKMLGQDDIFSMAMISSQLKNMDQQMEKLLEVGIPEESLTYMGMVGFRIKINIHGEVIEIIQPGMIDPDYE